MENNLPRGVYCQGNVNLANPREALVHLDVTDMKRVRLGLTNVVSVACKNGGYHICFTSKRELVTCPVCKEAIN